MANQTNTSKNRLLWFDALRGLAMLWIVFYHFIADTGRLGGFVLSNPAHLLGTINNAVWIFGSLGAQGVHMFIVLSGAGLAYAWSRKKMSVSDFYRRHFRRLLIPYYISMMGLFLAWLVLAFMRAEHGSGNIAAEFINGARIGGGPFTVDIGQILNMFLVMPRMYFMPYTSAWFVALLVQLYIFFPFLARLMDRLGRWRFWWMCFGISIFFTTLFRFSPVAPWVPPASIFGLARLSEFALGMVFGWRLASIQPTKWWRWSALALGAWLIGTFFPINELPQILIAMSATVMAVPVAGALAGFSWLTWIGRRSLEVFLIHDLVRFAYSSWPIAGSWLTQWPLGFLFYAGAIAILSLGFVRINNVIMKRFGADLSR